MTDLDYALVIRRLGLGVGDTTDDLDDDPDVVWCDSGTIELIPDYTYVNVPEGTPVPFGLGIAVYTCQVSQGDDPDAPNYYVGGSGFLLYNGKPFIKVVDLTSPKVNPFFGDNIATHKVRYVNVMAGSTPVAFPTVDVRLTKDGDGISPDNANDLAIVSPVVPGAATPIYQGPQGTSVTDVSIVDGTDLAVEFSDGTTTNAGTLPVGPGGSDPGVATYLANPASDTSEQTGEAALDPDHPLGAAIATLIADIPTEEF